MFPQSPDELANTLSGQGLCATSRGKQVIVRLARCQVYATSVGRDRWETYTEDSYSRKRTEYGEMSSGEVERLVLTIS